MRLYPAKPYLRRICTRDYLLPMTNEIIIDKGTSVYVSVLAFHHDKKYFSNPQKFNPERFRTEQTRFVYMPFGCGPRQCFGQDYAKVFLLITLARLVVEFQAETFCRTLETIDFRNHCFTKSAQDIKLRVNSREELLNVAKAAIAQLQSSLSKDAFVEVPLEREVDPNQPSSSGLKTKY